MTPTRRGAGWKVIPVGLPPDELDKLRRLAEATMRGLPDTLRWLLSLVDMTEYDTHQEEPPDEAHK